MRFAVHIPEIIRERRSIRAFSSEEVTEEEAELLVEAACLAPIAGNLQPWEFVVVRNSERSQQQYDEYERSGLMRVQLRRIYLLHSSSR